MKFYIVVCQMILSIFQPALMVSYRLIHMPLWIHLNKYLLIVQSYAILILHIPKTKTL